MRLESKSRGGDASGEIRGIRITWCAIAHRRSVFHGSDQRGLVSQCAQATEQLRDH